MNRLESLLKQAFRIRASKISQKKGKCLSDETIACVIENKISGGEEEKVNDHIIHCHSCAERISNYLLTSKALAVDGLIQPPVFLMDKVKQLVAERMTVSDVLDIVLDIKDKVLELLHTTGDLLSGPQLAPALRGKDAAGLKKSIHVVKNFDRFSAEVEIEKRVSRSADLILRITEKESKKRADGIRVSLLKNEREVESQIMEAGKVKFEDIKPDTYKVLIIKDDKTIGSVNIEMRQK